MILENAREGINQIFSTSSLGYAIGYWIVEINRTLNENLLNDN